MGAELSELQNQLQDAVQRIEGLEQQMRSLEESYRWQHLVYRPHRWRRQLSFRQRRMTVGQFISSYVPNHYTPETASEDFDLPIDAIREALQYYEENKGLIQAEAAEERRRLAEKGYPLEPKDLRR